MNFIIPLVIYPFDVMFSLGETDEQLKKQFKKYNIEESNYFEYELQKGRCSQFKTGQVIVRLKHKPKTINDLACLQHEIYHAVNYILSFIGIKYSDDSEEAYAYLITYLTEQCYKKLKVSIC